jgi:hypothetical protein
VVSNKRLWMIFAFVAAADAFGILLSIYATSMFLMSYSPTFLGYAYAIAPIMQMIITALLAQFIINNLRVYFISIIIVIISLSFLKLFPSVDLLHWFVFVYFISITFLRTQVTVATRLLISSTLDRSTYEKKFNLILSFGTISVFLFLLILSMTEKYYGVNVIQSMIFILSAICLFMLITIPFLSTSVNKSNSHDKASVKQHSPMALLKSSYYLVFVIFFVVCELFLRFYDYMCKFNIDTFHPDKISQFITHYTLMVNAICYFALLGGGFLVRKIRVVGVSFILALIYLGVSVLMLIDTSFNMMLVCSAVIVGLSYSFVNMLVGIYLNTFTKVQTLMARFLTFNYIKTLMQFVISGCIVFLFVHFDHQAYSYLYLSLSLIFIFVCFLLKKSYTNQLKSLISRVHFSRFTVNSASAFSYNDIQTPTLGCTSLNGDYTSTRLIRKSWDDSQAPLTEDDIVVLESRDPVISLYMAKKISYLIGESSHKLIIYYFTHLTNIKVKWYLAEMFYNSGLLPHEIITYLDNSSSAVDACINLCLTQKKWGQDRWNELTAKAWSHSVEYQYSILRLIQIHQASAFCIPFIKHAMRSGSRLLVEQSLDMSFEENTLLYSKEIDMLLHTPYRKYLGYCSIIHDQGILLDSYKPSAKNYDSLNRTLLYMILNSSSLSDKIDVLQQILANLQEFPQHFKNYFCRTLSHYSVIQSDVFSLSNHIEHYILTVEIPYYMTLKSVSQDVSPQLHAEICFFIDKLKVRLCYWVYLLTRDNSILDVAEYFDKELGMSSTEDKVHDSVSYIKTVFYGSDISKWVTSILTDEDNLSNPPKKVNHDFLLYHFISEDKDVNMNDLSKISVMRKSGLFSSLSLEQLQVVINRCDYITKEPGDVLFEKGDSPDGLYILFDGTMLIYDDVKTVATVSSVEVIGDVSLVDLQERMFSVKANTQCQLLFLSKNYFNYLCDDVPEIYLSVARRLVKYLRSNYQSDFV